jgi:hypothetical protein
MHLALYLMQSGPDPEQMRRLAMAILTILPFLMLVGLIIVIVPCWFICKKAGFSPWLSLLNLVPFGQVVLLYVLAFAEWKVVPVPPIAWPPQPPYPPRPPVPPVS